MNFSRPNFSRCLIVLIVLCASTAAFAKLPVRRSSQNGENGSAQFWNLLSIGQPLSLAANGKKVVVTRQIVCIDQNVGNAQNNPDPLLTGTCTNGRYLHIFQFKSTTTASVTITIGQLVGFVQSTDPDNPNYGVMTCDSPENTVELCTNDTNPADIPTIAFSVAKNKTSVSFVVPAGGSGPSFPNYPAGVDKQGQGLTLFVLVDQGVAHPSPIQLPKVAIK
jgi:hypothetical protein